MPEPDLKELMQMAQEMQKSMKEAHDDLSRQEYVGESGGGLVKVVADGRHELRKITLDPKVRNEELDIILDLVIAAANSATQAIEKAAEKRMFDLTKKLGLPKGETS